VELKDAETIHVMQAKSFKPLLEKYQDFETSPANEPVEKIVTRINQPFTDYYVIENDGVTVGAIRIVKMGDQRYRVSPIFILPEHQGKGIAQKLFEIIEKEYCDAKVWELDTLLQEKGNCYLYEKLGYKQTGKMEPINSKMTLVFYEKYLTPSQEI
jgi:GNAT superfamily N-acetyltransferase